MKLKKFFEHFELLADAPNGVQKLREMILQLAVQGKLVSQNPKDEPASVLLEKVTAVKEQLVKEGKIRKPKSLPAINADEIPYELPDNWQWVRLNDYGDWGAGATPNRSKLEYYGGDTPWFKSGELNDDVVTESDEYVTKRALQDCSLRLNVPGDVLIAMYGATIGKVAVTGVESTTNQAVCACTCHKGILNHFLLMLLKAYKPLFILGGTGGAQPNISKVKIVNTVVPLPPLNEQKRIVAKVDELMGFCDELETNKQNAATNCLRLNNASLQGLVRATAANKFNRRWQRICDNFDVLYSRPENVVKLRQTILQLAVQGKLVPQKPKDEPASMLLAKIKAEKDRLVKDGKIKKPKPLPAVTTEDMLYELPDKWACLRLESICELITDGTHLTPKYTNEGRIFLSAQNVKPFRFMPENHRYVSEKDYQNYVKNKKAEYGDVLLTRVGAGIGEAAVIDKRLDFAIYVSLGLIKPLKNYLTSEFLVLWLNSPSGRGYSKRNTYGKGVSQGNLNLGLIRNFVIGLPPLREQKRIVAKVDELMGFCDALEAGLSESQTDCNTLMEAAVAEIMAA